MDRIVRKYINEHGCWNYPSFNENYNVDVYSKDGSDPSIMWMMSDWKTGFSQVIPKYFHDNDLEQTTVVQAGGNVGLYPYLLSEHFKTVYTFEPDVENFDCMCTNLQNRNILNIIKFQAALSNENGSSVLYKTDFNGQHALFNCTDAADINLSGAVVIETPTVQTMTIDSLKLDECSLIMLDVEHGEYNAIIGAINTINMYKPVIILEQAYEESKTILLSLMNGLGYTLYHDFGQDAMYVPIQG